MSASKPFQASKRKILEARKKGQRIECKNLVFGLNLLTVLILIMSLFQGLSWFLEEISLFWHFSEGVELENVLALLIKSLEIISVIAGPVLVVNFVAVFLAEFSLGGLTVAWSNFKVDFSKLSPANGLKKVFGNRESNILSKVFANSLITFSVMLTFAGLSVYNLSGSRAFTQELNFKAISESLFSDLTILVIQCLLVGLFSYFFARAKFYRKLRMDHFELKREFRETEGSPELRAHRKTFFREVNSGVPELSARKAKVVLVSE